MMCRKVLPHLAQQLKSTMRILTVTRYASLSAGVDLRVHKLDAGSDAQVMFDSVTHYSNVRLDSDVYFGKDEFPSVTDMHSLLSCSDSFAVTDSLGTAMGYIILTPSWLFGHDIAAYADIRIIPRKDKCPPGYFPKLLKTAVKLTQELDYEACVYESFMSNVNMLQKSRGEGFMPLVIVPHSGNTFDMGWQDNVILMKDIKNIEVTFYFAKNIKS